MPIYEYKCDHCGHQFEKLMRISADAPPCGNCGKDVRKLVSAAGFILKGGGWYKDHYGLKSSSPGSESSSSSDSSSSESSGSSESSKASPESTPTAAAKSPESSAKTPSGESGAKSSTPKSSNSGD